jgi:hypothetical protein
MPSMLTTKPKICYLTSVINSLLSKVNYLMCVDFDLSLNYRFK